MPLKCYFCKEKEATPLQPGQREINPGGQPEDTGCKLKDPPSLALQADSAKKKKQRPTEMVSSSMPVVQASIHQTWRFIFPSPKAAISVLMLVHTLVGLEGETEMT